MTYERISRNRVGIQAGRCCMCDRTDVPLRAAGASDHREACTYCSAVWKAATSQLGHSQRTHPDRMSTTELLYRQRAFIIRVQAEGMHPYDVARALEAQGAFN
jgi:hypothetical protein